MRRSVPTHVVLADDQHLDGLIERNSSFRRIVRVTGWINRFISNTLPPKSAVRSKYIQTDEYNAAEITLVRHVQKSAYRDEVCALTDNREIPVKSHLRKPHSE